MQKLQHFHGVVNAVRPVLDRPKTESLLLLELPVAPSGHPLWREPNIRERSDILRRKPPKRKRPVIDKREQPTIEDSDDPLWQPPQRKPGRKEEGGVAIVDFTV